MNRRKRLITIFVLINILFYFPTAHAATQDQKTSYDKEQLKQDYRAFLQQLKTLNSQYKEITGEFGKIMKEEGVPSWDMGESAKDLATTQKQEVVSQDLGGGAFLKESGNEMILTLELPGFKKDSIKLSFQDGKKINVNANRKLDNTTKSYERSFDLPFPGDVKLTTAQYQDGILNIKIPKVVSKEVVIPIR